MSSGSSARKNPARQKLAGHDRLRSLGSKYRTLAASAADARARGLEDLITQLELELELATDRSATFILHELLSCQVNVALAAVTVITPRCFAAFAPLAVEGGLTTISNRIRCFRLKQAMGFCSTVLSWRFVGTKADPKVCRVLVGSREGLHGPFAPGDPETAFVAAHDLGAGGAWRGWPMPCHAMPLNHSSCTSLNRVSSPACPTNFTSPMIMATASVPPSRPIHYFYRRLSVKIFSKCSKRLVSPLQTGQKVAAYVHLLVPVIT